MEWLTGWGISFENQSCCPIYFKRVFGAVLSSPHHKAVTLSWCDWPGLLRKIILEPQWPPPAPKGSGEGAVAGERDLLWDRLQHVSPWSRVQVLISSVFSLLNGRRNVTCVLVAVSVIFMRWALLSRFLVSEVLTSCFIKPAAKVSRALAEVTVSPALLPQVLCLSVKGLKERCKVKHVCSFSWLFPSTALLTPEIIKTERVISGLIFVVLMWCLTAQYLFI